ncbi:hypothetical protein [Rhizobium rhizogenes]|uniref:hypothetical protein n=1 Tax=Rhizobium rhizogenes TaxID=359 RepID=UPI000B1FF889|nr:hypothetical protein [Rhizobium rhizogenes]NTI80379.1 hypothetical protein [Rhizobium rhizogenes]NTJ22565.1 hypothetical protein [Rhizobium rhizogenes]QUE81271.1 hypothetical protein EML492_05545 [Rhizobium rhizogenes]TQO80629.1 hypothetical protein FFE80_05875 [Rhizobium rhizogenes]TRB52588.1 hypothetical protein EXN69_23375 [Rhizobium rhizogenes]
MTIEELIAALDGGHWQASVYHCPPPRNRRDNPIKNATLMRLSPSFPNESSALEYASKAIASGWAGNTIVHQESAKPLASFILSRDAIDVIGRSIPTLRAFAQEKNNAE